MARKRVGAKKRNQTDTTLRNLRAGQGAMARLRKKIGDLETRVEDAADGIGEIRGQVEELFTMVAQVSRRLDAHQVLAAEVAHKDEDELKAGRGKPE